MSQRTLRAALGPALALAFVSIAAPAGGATFTVTTTADSGAGSLRAAIASANANPGPDTIEFAVTGTITLATPLPALLESVFIHGPGTASLVIDAASDQRHFRFAGPATQLYLLQDLTLRNGSSTDAGGSVLVTATAALTVRRCRIEDSTAAASGGGIAAFGTVHVLDSVLWGNAGAFGGGLYAEGSGHQVKGSTLALNLAGQGGGVYLGTSGELEIENSTLVGNMADSAGSAAGGGVSIAAGLAALSHVTLAFNLADEGAGVALVGGAVTTFANNVLADNRTWTDGPANCLGVSLDDFGNLSSDHTCIFLGPSDLINTDPELENLADNGGPTPTMMLSGTSPARDSALTGFCSATDQRGRPRPSGPLCDRGAVEVDLTDLAIFADGFESGGTGAWSAAVP